MCIDCNFEYLRRDSRCVHWAKSPIRPIIEAAALMCMVYFMVSFTSHMYREGQKPCEVRYLTIEHIERRQFSNFFGIHYESCTAKLSDGRYLSGTYSEGRDVCTAKEGEQLEYCDTDNKLITRVDFNTRQNAWIIVLVIFTSVGFMVVQYYRELMRVVIHGSDCYACN